MERQRRPCGRRRRWRRLARRRDRRPCCCRRNPLPDLLLPGLQLGDVACHLLLPSGYLVDLFAHHGEAGGYRLKLRWIKRRRWHDRLGSGNLCCLLRCRNLNYRLAWWISSHRGSSDAARLSSRPIQQPSQRPSMLRGPIGGHVLGDLTVRLPGQRTTNANANGDQVTEERIHFTEPRVAAIDVLSVPAKSKPNAVLPG
jgi:hypothetical protein